MLEKIAISAIIGMLSGIVLGMLLMAAIERRRYEALARDIEEIAAATVLILDKFFAAVQALLESNGGASSKNG